MRYQDLIRVLLQGVVKNTKIKIAKTQFIKQIIYKAGTSRGFKWMGKHREGLLLTFHKFVFFYYTPCPSLTLVQKYMIHTKAMYILLVVNKCFHLLLTTSSFKS